MAAVGNNEACLLDTVLVRVCNPRTGEEVVARALLDPGSQLNIVTKKLVNKLELTETQDSKATVLNQVQGNSDPLDMLTKFVIKHRDHDNTNLPIKALVMDVNNWTVRLPAQLPTWINTRNVELADPELVNSQGEKLPFDILLSNAECNQIVWGFDYKAHKFAIKSTTFGLIPSGGIPRARVYNTPPAHWCLVTQSQTQPTVNKFYKARPHKMMDDNECDDIELTQDIARSYELDQVDMFGKQEDDQEALQGFLDETIQSFERRDGRVYTKLPKFHGMSQPLAKNHAKVQAQLKSLEKRMKENPDLANAYEKAIQEWVDMKVLVPTTVEEMNKFEYWAEMPYHPVFRKGVKTHKVRFVMNGSADEPGKAAINRYLATGPNILPQITNILTMWRASQFFSIADIEKAFLQVGLQEPDDHLFLFRWLVRNEDGTYRQETYRFAMMPWGINCAPFVLNAVVRYLYQEASKLAQQKNDLETVDRFEKLSSTTYVDDILALGNCVEDVVKMAHDAHRALEEGKMTVCKYRTWPPEMAKLIHEGLDPVREVYKVLGIRYDPPNDEISPAADKLGEYKDKECLTKKQAAGLVARLFDPLGLAAPTTLKSKLLLQLIEKHHPKAAWNTKLSKEESAQWHEYVKDVEENLPNFTFPRRTRPAKYDKLRLCVFSDASAQAVAGTLYEVAEVDGKMYPCLANARNRVIPHKKRFTTEGVDTLTKDSLKINRLELTAATLAAQMAEQHIAATQTKFDEVLAFTDSQVSCHWLWSQSEHHTEYVRTRVNTIKKVIPPKNWRHIPGSQNPADLASRGCSLSELVQSKLWRCGPEWMSQDRSQWPEIPADAKEKLNTEVIDQQVFMATSLKVTTRSQRKKLQVGTDTSLIKPCSIPLTRIDQPPKTDSGYNSQDVSDSDDDMAELVTKSKAKPKNARKSKSTVNSSSIQIDWDTYVKLKHMEIQQLKPSSTIHQALASLLVDIQRDQLGNLYKNVQGTLPDRYLTDSQRNLKHQYGLRFDAKTQLVMSRSRNFRVEELGELRKPVQSTESEKAGLAPIDQDLVFLTAEGPRVKALVRKLHEKATGHGSVNHVAAESRKNYWILNVRKLAKDVRRHCKDCQLLDAKALKQVEGALPKCRYDATNPETNVAFQAIGVDFVGPFFPFKGPEKKKKHHRVTPYADQPAMIAVFSCAKTRAIHLEPVRNQGFEQFELAFRNFTARRGTPAIVYSDNAPTFKLADKLSVFRKDVAEKLKQKYAPEMEWIFNANRAPWWGGFFERMMRIIKEKLARNFYRHVFPSPDHFRAAVVSLEQFVNSRPLTTIYSKRDDYPPISPEMFLKPGRTPSPFEFMQFALLPAQVQSLTALEAVYRRRAQMHFQARLWFDFQHMYLDGLRTYHKTSSVKNDAHKVQPGMCVLITPDDTSFKPRAMLHKALWRRGMVTKLFLGRDGRCRTVEIEMKDKTGKIFKTVYPIQKLCPLELSATAKAEFLDVPNV